MTMPLSSRSAESGAHIVIQSLLLHLLFAILLFMAPLYPAILLCRSVIILGDTSSTYPVREEDEWKGERRGDSRASKARGGVKSDNRT